MDKLSRSGTLCDRKISGAQYPCNPYPNKLDKHLGKFSAFRAASASGSRFRMPQDANHRHGRELCC
jgi:hypothetical protein